MLRFRQQTCAKHYQRMRRPGPTAVSVHRLTSTNLYQNIQSARLFVSFQRYSNASPEDGQLRVSNTASRGSGWTCHVHTVPQPSLPASFSGTASIPPPPATRQKTQQSTLSSASYWNRELDVDAVVVDWRHQVRMLGPCDSSWLTRHWVFGAAALAANAWY
jgi:hypothetical protein